MPTKIEWTDETWNPIAGCTKCSPGCLNCYAERMAIRLNGIFAAKGDNDNWCKMTNVLKWDMSQIGYEFGEATGWNGQIELFHNRLDIPLHWKKPRRIFVCSMSDLFHPKVPFEFVDKVFNIICLPDRHTFLLLTKRIKRAEEYFKMKAKSTESLNKSFERDGLKEKCIWPWPNVHLGVSISTQAEMWKAKVLVDIPVAVRFVSFEPLLEDIKDINTEDIKRLDGAIIGCESGPNRRECKNEWVMELVEDFQFFNKPVFVKQININGKVSRKPEEWPEDLRIRQLP